MIHITAHACERFIERVAACTLTEAKAAILSHAKAIEVAAAFNCTVVKLSCGARLVLDGRKVITVYGANTYPRQCRSPYRIGGEA